MRAIITPYGFPAISVDLDNAPTWSDNEVGGWQDASFTANLDQATRERLYGAEVVLVASSPVYFGFVKTWQGDSITCEGWYERCKTIAPRAVCYADDSLESWEERTSHSANQKMEPQVDGTVLRLKLEDSVAIGTKSHGFTRRVNSTSACRQTFSWSRPSTAIRLRLLSGTWAYDQATGAQGTFPNTEWSQVNGSGALTGTATVDITNPITGLQLLADAPGGYTPGADTSIYWYSLTTYGLGWSTCTPDDIITEMEANLPAYLTPGVPEIAVDDVNTLIPANFDDGATPHDIIGRVLDYTDAVCRFESRPVNGTERPALVFKSRETASTYAFDASREQVKLTGGDLSNMASHVRVQYTDVNGTPQYVDVAASAGTLYEQWYDGATWQRTRYVTINADTTSSTVATTIGETYLAIASREQVGGTVTVTQVVNGVSPAEIQAGRMCTITNTDRGTVVAYIRQVDHTGDSQATLTLDNTPLLDDLLARLARRTQSTRFNYVDYIDRRTGR